MSILSRTSLDYLCNGSFCNMSDLFSRQHEVHGLSCRSIIPSTRNLWNSWLRMSKRTFLRKNFVWKLHQSLDPCHYMWPYFEPNNVGLVTMNIPIAPLCLLSHNLCMKKEKVYGQGHMPMSRFLVNLIIIQSSWDILIAISFCVLNFVWQHVWWIVFMLFCSFCLWSYLFLIFIYRCVYVWQTSLEVNCTAGSLCMLMLFTI